MRPINYNASTRIAHSNIPSISVIKKTQKFGYIYSRLNISLKIGSIIYSWYNLKCRSQIINSLNYFLINLVECSKCCTMSKKMRVNFVVKHRPLLGEHVLNGRLLLDNVKPCHLWFNNKIQIVEWDRTHFFNTQTWQ